jgi:hypothetical protein
MAQFAKVARTADLAAEEAKCVEVAGKKIARSTWRGASTSSTTPARTVAAPLQGRSVGQEGHVTNGPSRTDREGKALGFATALARSAMDESGRNSPCGLKSAAGVSYGENERLDESREGH